MGEQQEFSTVFVSFHFIYSKNILFHLHPHFPSPSLFLTKIDLGMRRYRQKSDMLNLSVAGLVTGSVVSIPMGM